MQKQDPIASQMVLNWRRERDAPLLGVGTVGLLKAIGTRPCAVLVILGIHLHLVEVSLWYHPDLFLAV